MILITKKDASTPAQMAEVLSGRLHALANAHALTSRNLSDLGSVAPALDLAVLLRTIVQPFDGTDAPRLSLNGPPIRYSEHAVNGLALIFHELATNCAKYGALKVESGRLEIAWRIENDRLVVRWIEHGGPPIAAPPATAGFGSRLMDNTIKRQFGGTVEFEWHADGFRTTITFALERLGA